MKIRATDEQIGALAVKLVGGAEIMDASDFELFDRLDDVSLQTLNTLVSQCPYCGDWTRLEDGDCSCSHSEQQFDDRIYYNGDSIDPLAYPSGLEELPEE